MGSRGGHAVVIGASLAGLCAARVLSDHYDRVTVIERDRLPDGPQNRPAVPQGQHLHLLMARGALEYEALFPGLLADMVDCGVAKLENSPDAIHFGAAGHVLGTGATLENPFAAYIPSRPHLEWQVRKRVLALRGVQLLRRSVLEPRFDPQTQTVTGVVLQSPDGEEMIDADLVVDATGRNSRTPQWFARWGFDPPAQEEIEVGIGYASQRVLIPKGVVSETVLVADASPGQPYGCGALHYEDGSWIVTTFGSGKAPPPKTFDGICDVVDELLPAAFAATLRASEPVGGVLVYRYPTSQWRRYDKLSRFPDNLVVFGDAVASFNPTYGQGMTMTSLQAANLRDVLCSGEPQLGPALASKNAKTIFPVWSMNAAGDLMLHNATGPAKWWYKPSVSLFDMLLGAAETDPVLAEWFLRKYNQLGSMWMVPTPRLIARTCKHNLRLWLGEKRAARTAKVPAER